MERPCRHLSNFHWRPTSCGRRSTPGPSVCQAANSASSISTFGQTHEPELERAILDEVGSYGRQLGRLGDALEVLLRHANLDDLSDAEQGTLDILMGQLAEIRAIKQQQRAEARGSLVVRNASSQSQPSPLMPGLA